MASGPQLAQMLECVAQSAVPVEPLGLERCLAACLADRELPFLEFVALAEGFRLLSGSAPTAYVLARTRSLLAAARAPGRGTDEPTARLLALTDSAGARLHSLNEHAAACELGIRPDALAAWLAREHGLSFVRWRRGALVHRAVRRLAETTDQVKQIAYELGYPQPHQMHRDFVAVLGLPPSRFRHVVPTRSHTPNQ